MAAKDRNTFEALFREFFKPLCSFALKYVKDFDEAKNLVHEVFIAVWEKYDALPEDTYFRGYLFTATRNRCLNYLRDHKQHLTLEQVHEPLAPDSSDGIEMQELQREIEWALNTLPEKCRMVFEMSRYEGLKYAQIAEKMGISVKTVEAQMTKALGILKEALARFISILLLWACL